MSTAFSSVLSTFGGLLTAVQGRRMKIKKGKERKSGACLLPTRKRVMKVMVETRSHRWIKFKEVEIMEDEKKAMCIQSLIELRLIFVCCRTCESPL